MNALPIDVICKDLPFVLVVSDSYQAYMHNLDLRYVPPTRKAISSSTLTAMYDRVKAKINQSLEKADVHAVTTTMWTSGSNHQLDSTLDRWKFCSAQQVPCS